MPGESTARSKARYIIGRWAFLRLLGIVYLIAFVSLWVQIDGLVGSHGILPVGDYLDRVRAGAGSERFWLAPTLLWLGHSDAALHALCAGGVLLSVMLIVGVATLPVLFLSWVVYLSVTCAGQTFLNFQWDALLLEAGFSALFLAPATWRPRAPWSGPPPRRAGLWVVWLLLFKLMFLSGVVKLLCMDETWWKLTALDYHYWTQPLPAWTSWYANRLPEWFDKLSVLLTYAIEIGAPFLIFAGRIGRRATAAATVFLMLMISLTGNFGFFNLLTVALCVPLLDDGLLARVLPGRWRAAFDSGPPGVQRGRVAGAVHTSLAVLVIGASTLALVQELVRTAPPDRVGSATRAVLKGADRWILTWGRPYVLGPIAPLRTINGYGLFRAMTTSRPEIVIEGSMDGRTWKAYEFRWKPGDVRRRPRFVAPYMPRLDWQMWFAALGPQRARPWLAGLLRGLLRGSPEVLGLLETNPFPEAPPRYVRLIYYRYEFATPAERRREGVWWHRTLVGPLTGPISLDTLSRARAGR